MADKEHVLYVETVADNYTLHGRPCEISAYSFIPTERNEPAERTVFNSSKKAYDLHRTSLALADSKVQQNFQRFVKLAAYQQEEEERKSHDTYDRIFRKVDGYNNKLHRDDREHAKSRGLRVNDEEKVKEVPTLASSDYGHRLETVIDPPDRAYVRIQIAKSEFYRRNGTD